MASPTPTPNGAPMRVLITGAASGLGLELALVYARRGAEVLLTDQNDAALSDAKTKVGEAAPDASRIHALLLDITDEDDWAAAREWVAEIFGGLDLLVNNAGVATGGRIDYTTIEEWDWVIGINLRGQILGAHTFVPMLKEQGSGQLLFTASLAAIVTPPTMASYNVTKAGVLALGETLRAELKPYGITTTVACPNFFKTNLASSLRTSDPMVAPLIEKLVSGSDTPADVIAARIVKGVDKGVAIVTPDRLGTAADLIRRHVPWYYRRKTLEAATKFKERADKFTGAGKSSAV